MSSDSELIRAMARYIISSSAESSYYKRQIKQILESTASMPQFTGDPMVDADRILLDLGAPTKLAGYQYCVKAIAIVAEDGYARRKMMDLYNAVAEEYHVSSVVVSRTIANLVDAVFDKTTIEVLVKYFGNSIDYNSGKVMPGEFIRRLASYIRGHK